ncbi:MAG: pyridine nucleotide-disulfide oxidoreductase [Muricauda sp.]|nr:MULTISPECIES: NAD(P)/FAD-dependent oxidoreductase [unclassified Allomuricauda]MAU16767.1 pyridine nucleotide-disulfide oxidoreductase [Allomuricauda sp.]|tara:strand:+ start:269 stop:1189 length:921 start_codon:yes stop_codon:yes gene_type:complete
MEENKIYDVIIIGGSYAGLSAALSLGRSLRKTLIIDAGEPCNKQTPHSHNFLTHDGTPPSKITLLAKKQVAAYDSISFVVGFATKVDTHENGFVVHLENGAFYEGKKIILATGIKDLMPEIPGFQDCWGISVIHCPYCHGYEYRGKKIGLLAKPEQAFHLASLLLNLGNDITIMQVEPSAFTKEQLKTLHQHNIKILNNNVTAIEHKTGYLQQVILDNGEKLSFSAIYAGLPFEQHSAIPTSLKCELTEQGYIKTDHFQKTSVPGVFACGDNCVPMRSVAQAVASGNIAGAVANMELSQESFIPIS